MPNAPQKPRPPQGSRSPWAPSARRPTCSPSRPIEHLGALGGLRNRSGAVRRHVACKPAPRRRIAPRKGSEPRAGLMSDAGATSCVLPADAPDFLRTLKPSQLRLCRGSKTLRSALSTPVHILTKKRLSLVQGRLVMRAGLVALGLVPLLGAYWVALVGKFGSTRLPSSHNNPRISTLDNDGRSLNSLFDGLPSKEMYRAVTKPATASEPCGQGRSVIIRFFRWFQPLKVHAQGNPQCFGSPWCNGSYYRSWPWPCGGDPICGDNWYEYGVHDPLLGHPCTGIRPTGYASCNNNAACGCGWALCYSCF